MLITVPCNYIALNGPFYITHRNLCNILLSHVHGRYRVFDAEVVRSGTGGRGGEVGAVVLQAVGRRGRVR